MSTSLIHDNNSTWNRLVAGGLEVGHLESPSPVASISIQRGYRTFVPATIALFIRYRAGMEEQCSAGKEIMALITRHNYSYSRPGRRSLCGLQSSERGYRGQNEANRSKMADGVLRWEHCALGCRGPICNSYE